MKKNENTLPYSDFGTNLKNLREGAKETIADVSGAVEIDNELLTTLEAGEFQPPEDLVLLLISHFSLREDEALKMWKLAGYDQALTGRASIGTNDFIPINQAFLANDDSKIIYTDVIHINANKYGLVMNFMQGLGTPGTQPMAVAKVGMSHEHAKSMLDVLTKALAMVEKESVKPQKQLPEKN